MATHQVYCIKPEDEKPSSLLQKAFKALTTAGLEPEWIATGECCKIKEKKSQVAFIADPFEGPAFVTLSSLKNRIYGPPCILECLKNAEALPKVPHPVYSMAMRDLKICFTGVETNIKAKIENFVKWMAGEYHPVLTNMITHLVAGKIGSKKYLVAGDMGVNIMNPEWVTAVWEACSTRSVSIEDEEFARMRCPIFKGLVLTVSGLDSTERQEVKLAVEAEGGRYTGEMKVNDCTHLLVKEPKGQKYDFALKWAVQVVEPKWLHDSISKGYCLDEDLYRVKKGKKSSTPAKNKKGSLACLDTTSNVSSIHNFSALSSVTHLDETAMSRISSGPLDNLDMSVFKGDLFLDGCKIFLSGFSTVELETLRKIINLGGGTRFSQINESVSHVVIGERIEEHVEHLKAAHFRPHVVSSSWLIESFRNGHLMPESDYYTLDLPPAMNPLSPPPKRNSSFVKPGPVRTDKPAAVSKPPASNTDMEDDMQQLLSQYMPEGGTQNTTIQPEEDEQPVASTSKGDGSKDSDMTLDPDTTCNPQSQEGGTFFKGLIFTLVGFAAELEHDLTEYVHEGGGTVLNPPNKASPDYAVVPIFGCPVKITVREVVTNVWLQMCIEEDRLIPVNEEVLFRPVAKVPNSQPLKECVLSVSSFSGVLRDSLLHLAEELGACVREYFNKQSVKGKKASTHLLISVPDGLEGKKYQAAIKWGVPVVTKEWLLECARTGEKVPEEMYSPTAEPENVEAESKSEIIPKESSDVSKTVMPPQKEESKPGKLSVVAAGPSTPLTNKSTSERAATTPNETRRDSAFTKIGDEEFCTPVTCRLTRLSTFKGSSEKSPTPVSHSTPSQPGPSMDTGAPTFKTPITTGRKSISTPRSLPNQRVKQLQDDSLSESKFTQPSPHSRGIDSPSKFLDSKVQFQPSFDLTEVMADLATPQGQAGKNSEKKRRRSSMSLDEMFSYYLDKGVKTMVPRMSFGEGCNDDDEEEEQDEEKGAQGTDAELPAHPLRGIVIGVSKKLNAKQSELNSLAASLGADYRWTYDQSCTHFVFQGRSNDNSKEYKLAKEHKKFIVSPYWLNMCKEQNARVDEALFPHNYNPNMTLSVLSSPGNVPSRGTRRSTRQAVKPPTDAKSLPATKETINMSKSPPLPCDGNVEEAEDMMPVDEDGADEANKSGENENNSDPENQPQDVGTGSLEMQEAVSKQLEDFMAATKGQRPGRRMSKRFNSNGSEESTGSGESKEKSRPPSRPRSKLAIQSDNNTKVTRSSSGSACKTPEPEFSQNVEVTWDDPTGRQEQEKLASVLDKPYSPTQESLSPVPPGCGDDRNNASEKRDYSSIISLKNFGPVNSPQPDVKPPPTPEAPPLAFPRPKYPNITTPEAVHVLDDDDDETPKAPPKFLMSAIDQSERATYGALIEQLGGQLHEAQNFHKSCTHLIAGNCSRNEKYLACMAAGKWILHKSYFEACREAGEFVKEDDHEWGNDSTAGMKNLTAMSLTLARAAKRWRVNLQVERRRNPQCGGAFQSWNVILCCGKSREGGFKRLLEAGGAQVIATRPPFQASVLEDADFAFIDQAKIDYQVDYQKLVENGVHCVKPDYISSYLQNDPPPNVEDLYLPEAKKYLTGSGTKKRKSSGSMCDVGKRMKKE